MKYFFLILIIFISCSKKEKKVPVIDTNPINPEKIKNEKKGLKAGQRLVPALKLKTAEHAIARGDFNKAIEIYDELIKLKSLSAESRSQLFAGRAEALFHLKKYEDSIAAWLSVISIRKEDPFPMHNLAIVYKESGKIPQAIELLNKILKLDSKMLIARIDLIELLKATGATQKELIEQVNSLDKGRDEIMKLLISSNDPVELVKYLNILIEIPEEKPPLETLKKLIESKSTFVKEKTSELLIRHTEGKQLLSKALESEKDPNLKIKMKKLLDTPVPKPDENGKK
ncbi:tetratricopeptide repeat protein [Myxococcota bacterium]|nr:tetratricopeptide repeat protein [Myxococcota bacterium]MBU1379555.1 tetratricopeptide repeat protein [Myxococcota bacterium]MBU1495273.1 tetratricopeptide repeat protein [Myxococcota bacterium]